MKVSADTAVCVSSGQCALLLPRVFDQREDDGVVVVRDESPPPELSDAVRQAVAGCPSGALSVAPDSDHGGRPLDGPEI
ncbi:ferredoxin [Dactylosporangium sp. AC04546]|nr:ferredoxin [Dactylosporangium sp. AC04546]WVK89637.1 ferredoxin [Dactylosporangium sp. AC04546]